MKQITFDDYVFGNEGLNDWSYICGDCVKTLNIPERLLDNHGRGFCGVKGCSNNTENDTLSLYYIDFDEDTSIEQKDNEVIVKLKD